MAKMSMGNMGTGKMSLPKASPYVKPLPNKEPQLKIQPIPMPTMVKEPALATKSKGKAQKQAGIVTRLPGAKLK